MTAPLTVFDHYPEDYEKYDLCLEFAVDPYTNKIDPIGLEVLDKLIGLFGSKYIYLFYSSDTSVIYALIRTTLKLVKQKAEAEGYKLLLDGQKAKERAYDGDAEALVDPFSIPHIAEISRIEPFEFIYGEYVSRPDTQDLYHCPEGMTHPFHKVLRLKLLSRMLSTSEHIAQEGELSLDYLLQGGVIRDFHPVHDQEKLDSLREDWVATCSVPWGQPFAEIRDYFGEKMTFFFLFLGFVGYWIMYPTLVGIAFQVMAIYFDDYNRPELPAFAFFISLWTVTMVRYWQRVQKVTAMKWNMTGVAARVAEREEVRYEYYGTHVKSPIDGKDTIYFHHAKRRGLYFVSVLFMLLAVAICLGTVAALFYVRHIIRDQKDSEISQYDQWITPAMLSLQITIANRVLYSLAAQLTHFENHRLDLDYDTSLTMKVFLMQFINASSSFFYLAFGATYVPTDDDGSFISLANSVRGCGPEDCITTLTVHILVIITTQVLGSAVANYWLPYLARMLYNCRCDVYGWWLAIVGVVVEIYSAIAVCISFCLSNSIAECCNGCIQGCYNCCCGAPLPTPVPLVRTNIGQGVDRSSMSMDYTVNAGTAPVKPSQMQRYISASNMNEEEEEDDVSELGIEDHVNPGRPKQREENKHNESFHQNKRDVRSPPPPLRSLSELRIGLSNPSVNLSPHAPNRSVSKTTSFQIDTNTSSANLGADMDVVDDNDVEVDVEEFEVPDHLVTRYFKFDQEHQLRRSYARIILLLSLICCFGCLMPGIFVAGLFLLHWEVRGKAWQLLMIYKRLFPHEVEDIGEAWNRVLNIVVTLTVLTNAALIAFAMKQFDDWFYAYRLALFIGIVLGCRFYKWILHMRVSETPPEVVIQTERAHFINDKLIRKTPDHEDNFATDIL